LWKQGPFESLSALCNAQKRLTAAAAAQADPNQPASPSSYCEDKGRLTPTRPFDPPYVSVHHLEVGETNGDAPKLWVAETTRGFFPASITLDAGTYDDRAATAYAQQISRLETRNGRLWLVLTRRRADFHGYSDVKPFDAVAELTFVCSLGEKLECHRAISAYGETGPSWSRDVWLNGPRASSPPFHPKPWLFTREVTVLPSGALRLGPCLDVSGNRVACRMEALGELLR
jgi:hypothetical protein